MPGHSLSAVIPVYNSQESLPLLVERFLAVSRRLHLDVEIILVNDASRDGSWGCIGKLAAAEPRIRGINLMRNYGQHNAILCGVRAARHEWIVTIDDDLQHPPEEIPKLLEVLQRGYDVVYGTPEHEQHGLWRDAASRVTKLALQSAMGADTARHVTAFRAFRTKLRDAFVEFSGPFVSIDVLLTWGTTRFASVLVRHDPRTIGSSNYTFTKLLIHALNMMTGFSTLPLQLASWTGFVFTLGGIGILIYVVGRFLIEGGSVPGFPFLASMIALFSGAQLFALGIIGEYLARMHFRTMDKPSYVVRDTLQAVFDGVANPAAEGQETS